MTAVVPSISAIGVASWDESYLVDHFPLEGDYAVVRDAVTGPGGTTSNIAMTARTLGADVTLIAKFGNDDKAEAIVHGLLEAGIRTDASLRGGSESDHSIVVVSRATSNRTIIWKPGDQVKRGDRLDIDGLFNADLTVIDCTDYELRKYLVDLPAHTRPDARLLGTLTDLAYVVADDKVDVALRHDVVVGNEREYQQLVGKPDPTDCLRSIGDRMSGSNLRLAVMTCGSRGSLATIGNESYSAPARPVQPVDTTGAGAAFAGALAYALALRWDPAKSLGFANTVASFVVTTLGAQSSLPSLSQVLDTLGQPS